MNKDNIKGGEVIASGGFGCVFSPALKCKNKKRTKNKITWEVKMEKQNPKSLDHQKKNLSTKLKKRLKKKEL
jgi:hypothetical protein